MNDFLVEEIYKNCERLRAKNHVEEKILHQMVEGHKGYREKLNKSLCKLEKTRKLIEIEYYYMEQEMRKLGLKRSISKATLEKLKNIEETTKKKDLTDPIKAEVEVEKQQQPVENPRSYARRMSSIGIMSTKLSSEFSDLKKIRKYSLDNEMTGANSSSHLVKSFRRLSQSNAESKHLAQPVRGRFSPSIFAPSGSIKTDLSDFYSPSNSIQPRIASRNHTASVFSRNRSSISSYSAVNLPKISRLSFSRSISSTNQINTSSSQNKDSLASKESKRRVSFGQIDLNQLDNPKLYRYSNSAAYERFKFNPHYYLPNGALKRKFSLPKLSDTLEAVKNCNYLRRKSIEETADQLEVVNIFKENKTHTSSASSTHDIIGNNLVVVSSLDS